MTKWWWSLGLFAVAAALLLFGILRLIDTAHGQGIKSVECVSQRTREHVRAITMEALDNAFKAQVGHLFAIWLKDPSPEPQRASAGMANAINAIYRARGLATKWNPPECPTND
jgi:hypothetical protein